MRQGRFEDGGPRRDLHRLAINRECDHTSLPSQLSLCRVLRNVSTPRRCGPAPSTVHETDACRAALVHDMGQVLVLEIAHGGEHRVGRCLPQPTQGAQAHRLAQAQQAIKISLLCLPVGDAGQEAQHLARPPRHGTARLHLPHDVLPRMTANSTGTCVKKAKSRPCTWCRRRRPSRPTP